MTKVIEGLAKDVVTALLMHSEMYTELDELCMYELEEVDATDAEIEAVYDEARRILTGLVKYV